MGLGIHKLEWRLLRIDAPLLSGSFHWKFDLRLAVTKPKFLGSKAERTRTNEIECFHSHTQKQDLNIKTSGGKNFSMIFV